MSLGQSSTPEIDFGTVATESKAIQLIEEYLNLNPVLALACFKFRISEDAYKDVSEIKILYDKESRNTFLALIVYMGHLRHFEPSIDRGIPAVTTASGALKTIRSKLGF
ncbi:MAG TPA: hypothetical protein VNG90_04790 [Candidatus Acidoferrum sp.]|nr:hypothetical protein [Candidatus Acidoferrum sp.]